MSFKESEPSESPNFSSNPKSIFEIFNKSTDNLQKVLKNSNEIETIISAFTNKNSSMYESLKKSINIMRLASEERRFTMTPLIAKYNENSHEEHQLHKLMIVDDIDHIFVNPISGIENVYYHYLLYIPIPKDILDIKDPKKQLKEHWDLVNENTPKNFKNNLIKEFEPLYTIGRVYGWNGSWLAYSVTVIDKNNFWSIPLVKTSYNGAQPFLAVKKGEFVILQNDETDISIRKAKFAIDKIENRSKQIRNIEFQKEKSIEVEPEWIAVQGIKQIDSESYKIEISPKAFGEKLGPASIDGDLTSSNKVLEFMKKDIMGNPLYEFTEEEIHKCHIHNKL